MFQGVRRVLRDDGVVWLNMGDAYTSSTKGSGGRSVKQDQNVGSWYEFKCNPSTKPKDLVGLPWRIAFALQADGWWLRADCIWHKPNPMPESVTDRPTRAHEYVFLLTKAARYYYDAEAVRGAAAQRRVSERGTGQIRSSELATLGLTGPTGRTNPSCTHPSGRNLRSVWTIPTEAYPEAHFATFPRKLVTPCIKAGSKEGDVVLDPFCGSGTTGVVATQLGRRFIGIEMNQDYCEMARRRIENPEPEPPVPDVPGQLALFETDET